MSKSTFCIVKFSVEPDSGDNMFQAYLSDRCKIAIYKKITINLYITKGITFSKTGLGPLYLLGAHIFLSARLLRQHVTKLEIQNGKMLAKTNF